MIQRFRTTLTEKRLLTKDVYLLKYSLNEPKEIEFQAGQYLIMLVPQAAGEFARRLYSIASPAYEKTTFDLVVKILPGGLGSEYVLKTNVGEEMLFDGPAGRFVLHGTQPNKVFLATGTGIAPIKSMLYQDLKKGNTSESKYSLRWGVPTYKDSYMVEEFVRLSNDHENFSFTICLSRETDLSHIPNDLHQYFSTGRITANYTPELTHTDYYICGNRDVVETLKNHMYESKIDNASVIFEKF